MLLADDVVVVTAGERFEIYASGSRGTTGDRSDGSSGIMF